MKKLFLLAMSALVVLGCNTKSSSKGEDKTETRELKTKIFQYEEIKPHTEASVRVAFPVGGDEELGDSIYAYIVETMKEQQSYEDDIDDYRNDGQGFVDFYGDKISYDLEEGWENYSEGDETIDETLSEYVTYNVLEDNDKYVTYFYEYSNFYGGDGYARNFGTTFLKDDCSRVTNEFLFKNPSSEKLLSLVLSVLKEKYCEGEEGIMSEEEFAGIERLPEADFCVTKDGLAFYYHAYEVSWAMLDGVLPWDKVEKFLTDEAKELAVE